MVSWPPAVITGGGRRVTVGSALITGVPGHAELRAGGQALVAADCSGGHLVRPVAAEAAVGDDERVGAAVQQVLYLLGKDGECRLYFVC